MATSEELRDALRSKAEAEAEKARAEAAKLRAEADAASLTFQQAKRRDEEELATNKHNCVYTFTGTVDSGSVQHCIDQLTLWMRTRPGAPITIIFHSPGGGVFAGMSLFDFIQEVRAAGHYVTTIALGMAASMAGILLQAGDKRVCGRESYVLIHEISSMQWGKTTELEDELKFMRRIQERVLNIFVARASGKVTKAYIVRNWKRKDWWLNSDECLKYGLVDEIR